MRTGQRLQPRCDDSGDGPDRARGRVLVVCTANICRSPLAAAVLEDLLAGSARPTPVEVTSAGTHARDGRPVDARSAAEAAAIDLDLSGHRARPLDAALVRGSDLVLTMTRTHRAAAIALAPRHLDRVFTWLEFASLARWAVADGDRTEPDGTAPTAARIAHLARPRVGLPARLDIADPFGRSTADYRLMAGQVVEAAADIAPLLQGTGA